jgi:serine protease Do
VQHARLALSIPVSQETDMPSILNRHKIAALVGVALIAGPAAVGLIADNVAANAAQMPASVNIANAGMSFAPIVAADKPAVVTITTKMKPTNVGLDESSQTGGNSPFDEEFRQFFGNQGIPMPQQTPDPRTQRVEALGSGFIIDPSGIIVTNNHVVDGAMEIKVTLDDGTELPAKLIGRDAKSDLAVLGVKAPHALPVVNWGDSDRLRAGDQILAIGNPFGIGTTVTSGIVSARGRDLNSGPYDDFIQIDAPINHGNSGGPLVDSQGHVVGINTAIYSPNGGSVGVGFAIPSDEAQKVVAKLIKSGSIEHGVMGVVIQPVTADVAEALGLAKPEGALIDKINPDSAAAHAGVKTGDVVTGIDGHAVQSPKDLSRAVADLTPGSRTQVEVWRNGKSQQLSMIMGGDKSDPQTASADSDQTGNADAAVQKVPTLGIGLTDLTADVRQAMNVPPSEKGVVVDTVNPDKAAAASGMQAGDIIVAVNQKPVGSARDVKAAIVAANRIGRKSVLFLVERGGAQTFIAVPFGNA